MKLSLQFEREDRAPGWFDVGGLYYSHDEPPSRGHLCAPTLSELEFQGYGIVMLGVVGAGEQCHRTALGSLQNRLPGFRPSIEFSEIFALKHRPFLRIVRE